MKTYAKIVVTRGKRPLDYIFDYKISKKMQDSIQIGMRVKVPFGNKNKLLLGYVVAFSSSTLLDEDKVKYIHSLIDDEPVISENLVSLAEFMSEKYFTSLPQCMMTIIPSSLQAKKQYPLEKTTKVAYLSENIEKIEEEKKQGTKRKQVVLFLETHGKQPISSIREALGISISPIQTLEKRGVLHVENEVKLRNVSMAVIKEAVHLLTKEQSNVLTKIFSKDSQKTFLLHGVTGSGKTEIYMAAIENMIKNEKDAIVLVPEIALTPQLVSRFRNRFGAMVSFTHSRLSEGERLDQWRKARNGDIKIMIGPRSALFSPFKNLGMVIIDEEHETTYQSDQNPKYDTREVAEELCRLSGAYLILGTATPTLETYYKAKTGKMTLLELKNRVNSTMPDVSIIDMRNELTVGNHTIFSRALFKEITRAIENDEQVILFLNRRGHSTFISCRQCGFVLSCPHCSVNFTYHHRNKELLCHYCGEKAPVPRFCPSCGSPHVKFFGLGTQKVEEEVHRFFPKATVMRMDFDTTQQKDSHLTIYQDFLQKKANILIGTQMIAKGLDFPDVTVVGVMAGDLSLYTGDFRSSERTFQLITQVAGRAGRRDKKGKVIIQTYQPEHFSYKTAKNHDYSSFYEEEMKIRKKMVYPPFAHFFSILLLSPDEKQVIQTAFDMTNYLKQLNLEESFEFLGPAPAYVQKVRNDFRWTLLIKGHTEVLLRNFVIDGVNAYKEDGLIPSNVRLQLTINPQAIL